jgi:hypothetical protein
MSWRSTALIGALAFLMTGMPSIGPALAEDKKLVPHEMPDTTAAYYAVRRFLGDLRGDYTLAWEPTYSQVSDALTVPDPLLRLGDGAALVSGCRRHSCMEKAAVVMSAKGEAVAVGIIHANCHFVRGAGKPRKKPDYNCTDSMRLTMFLTRDGAYREVLESWADPHIKGGRFAQPDYLREIVWIEPKAGKGGKAQPNRGNE